MTPEKQQRVSSFFPLCAMQLPCRDPLDGEIQTSDFNLIPTFMGQERECGTMLHSAWILPDLQWKRSAMFSLWQSQKFLLVSVTWVPEYEMDAEGSHLPESSFQLYLNPKVYTWYHVGPWPNNLGWSFRWSFTSPFGKCLLHPFHLRI